MLKQAQPAPSGHLPHPEVEQLHGDGDPTDTEEVLLL